MKHHLTHLDHPVIGVRDLAAGRAAYEKLGFIVPPRGRHPQWGTGNWCIQFAGDYLELRGLIDPQPVPAVRELQAFLARREGLMGIAFGTTGAEQSRVSLAAAGLHPTPLRPLTRDFELPEGTLPVSFELCFLPREETPGLMHVVICGHLTPERLRRPEWLLHPNGAKSVTGLVAVAPDPAAALEAWSRLFENTERTAGGIRAQAGSGKLLLLTPDAFSARYPGCGLPPAGEQPCLGAVVLGVASPAATRDWLLKRGLGLETGGRVVARPELACGALLEFSARPGTR